jgi:hypothetical protein
MLYSRRAGGFPSDIWFIFRSRIFEDRSEQENERKKREKQPWK